MNLPSRSLALFLARVLSGVAPLSAATCHVSPAGTSAWRGTTGVRDFGYTAGFAPGARILLEGGATFTRDDSTALHFQADISRGTAANPITIGENRTPPSNDPERTARLAPVTLQFEEDLDRRRLAGMVARDHHADLVQRWRKREGPGFRSGAFRRLEKHLPITKRAHAGSTLPGRNPDRVPGPSRAVCRRLFTRVAPAMSTTPCRSGLPPAEITRPPRKRRLPAGLSRPAA